VAKYLNDLDYYKFCNDCLDSPHDLLAGFNTSNGLRDGNKTTLPRNFLLYGHVHMAQTRGSDLNGALALNYERVCGHKGYSYDAFQANERFWKNPASIDSVGHSFPTHSRLRVPYEIMDEIGYEDCDFVSQERDWTWWKTFSSWNVSVELHLPCPDPMDHLLSTCHFLNVSFSCEGDLAAEIQPCLVFSNRFHPSLNGSKEFPNFRMKCFRDELTSTYIEYMGTKLQRKRFESTYVHIPSNLPRNKSNECLWSNESAKLTVAKYLNELDYYKFCSDCIGSPRDLLANWRREGEKQRLRRLNVFFLCQHVSATFCGLLYVASIADLVLEDVGGEVTREAVLRENLFP
jgi:hypothetical protein